MNREKGRQVGRKSPANIAFNIFNYAVLIFLSLLCLYPVLYVVFASLSEPSRLVVHRGLLLKPDGFTLRGYAATLKDSSILMGYKNTIIYVVTGTALNMVLTICGAFTLSRPGLMGKKAIMILIIITMHFGGGLIPTYLLERKLGLFNNIWAMIIPNAISTWDMIILRTGFQSVPRELEESAIIDGASQFKILKDVLIPLSKPVLAVILLYFVVGHWNAWFNAMVLLDDRTKYPLQLLMRELLVSSQVTVSAAAESIGISEIESYSELIKYCVIVISTAPIMCIYPFVQKYFVKGVFVGSLKG